MELLAAQIWGAVVELVEKKRSLAYSHAEEEDLGHTRSGVEHTAG